MTVLTFIKVGEDQQPATSWEAHSRDVNGSAHPCILCVCAHTLEWVCVPAQLKVNSLRLSDSPLQSGDCRDPGGGIERARGKGGPIPDIAPSV